MKTGLVLEGGAMRGMFTAGVLDVLMEHDITVDGAIGVSAGAVADTDTGEVFKTSFIRQIEVRRFKKVK